MPPPPAGSPAATDGGAAEGVFDEALEQLDDTGSSQTSCRTACCRGRVSYRLMLLIAMLHVVWLLLYGRSLITEIPECQANCVLADVLAAATPAAGSCLLVATTDFGTCAVTGARSVTTASGAVLEVADLSNGSPACMLGSCGSGSEQMGTHGEIQCVLQPGETVPHLHFADDPHDAVPEEERLCYTDSVGFKDVDDDSYPQCVPDGCPTRIQQQFAAWLQIFSAGFFFAFAADWLGRENDFAMFAFFAALCFLEFRALGVAITGINESDLVGLNAVVTTLLSVVYVVLARMMVENFGLYIYRYTKVDVDLRGIFLNLTLLRTFLKVDVAVFCLNLIACYIFFMQSTSEFVVTLVFFMVLQTAKLACYRGAKHEDKRRMIVGLVALAFEPIYMLIMNVRMLSGTWQGVSTSSVFGLFIISLIVRAITAQQLLLVWDNFGKGLKERLEGKSRKSRLERLGLKTKKDADRESAGLIDEQAEPVEQAAEDPASAAEVSEGSAERRLTFGAHTAAVDQEEDDGTAGIELEETHEDDHEQGPCHHWGDLMVDDRGHRRHYWSCCGKRLNSDPDPETAQDSNACVACAVHGPQVVTLIDKWKELQAAHKAAEKVARIHAQEAERQKSLRPDGAPAGAGADAGGTDFTGDHDDAPPARPKMNFLLHEIAERPKKATSNNLVARCWKTLQQMHTEGDSKLEKVAHRLNAAIEALDHDDACAKCECNGQERATWQEDWVYVRNLHELVKTEEIFVKMLMFVRRNYFEPLDRGKRGAPDLSSSDVGSIFSGIIHRPRTGPTDSVRSDEIGEEEVIPDLITLHSEYVWPALLEEERQKKPSIAAFFQRIVANELLVHQLAMAVPIAANEGHAHETMDELAAEDECMKKFMDDTKARFQPVPEDLTKEGLKGMPLQLNALLARPRRRIFEYRNVVEVAIKHLTKRVKKDERHTMTFEAAELRGLEAVMVELSELCQYMNDFTNNTHNKMRKVVEVDHLMGVGHFRQTTNVSLVTPQREWKKGDGTDALFFEWDFEKQVYHSKPRQLLLFNDLLVTSVPTKSHKHPLDYKEFFYARHLTVCEKTETHLLIHDSKTNSLRAYKIDDQMGMNDLQRAHLVRTWIVTMKETIDGCDHDDTSWSDLQMRRLKEAAEDADIDLDESLFSKRPSLGLETHAFTAFNAGLKAVDEAHTAEWYELELQVEDARAKRDAQNGCKRVLVACEQRLTGMVDASTKTGKTHNV